MPGREGFIAVFDRTKNHIDNIFKKPVFMRVYSAIIDANDMTKTEPYAIQNSMGFCFSFEKWPHGKAMAQLKARLTRFTFAGPGGAGFYLIGRRAVRSAVPSQGCLRAPVYLSYIRHRYTIRPHIKRRRY